MKLKLCLPIALLAWAACNAPESANQSPRCTAKSDCAPDEICYRGFCVVPPDLGTDVDSDVNPVGAGEPQGAEPRDAGATASDPGMSPPPPPSRAEQDAATTPGKQPPASAPATGLDGGQEGGSSPAAMPGSDGGSGALDSALPAPAALGCSRELLRRRADAYLAALAAGSPSMLATHPAVRYTENGQMQALGRGLWASRPQAMFSRHFMDEARCSSITEAVLNELTGRIVFGVRLRYVDDQLLEVEAQVVRPNTQYYDPNAIIPVGPDPWLEAIPATARMSRDELTQLATRYLLASSDPSLLPPHTPACRRRQNGTLMDQQGSCGARPGDRPFEEQRFPFVDEETGVVAAVVIYNRFLGLYLFKARGGTFENINIVGGNASRTTGW